MLLNKNSYKELLKTNTNDEYIFLEDYITSKEPILCKHKVCDNSWKVAPYEIIKRGSRCPECSKQKLSESKKGSIESLTNKLEDVYGYNPYEFLSDYIDWNTHIKVKCLKCDTKQEVTPLNMFNSRRKKSKNYPCTTCDFERRNKGKGLGKRKNKPLDNNYLNKNNYKELLKTNTNDEYIFLEDYITSKEPILCKHIECDNNWKVAPYEIIKRGTRCPECSNKEKSDKQKWNLEILKQRLFEIFGYIPYEFLSDYESYHEKMKVKCLKCNTIQGIQPNNMINSFSNKLKQSEHHVCKTCSTERAKLELTHTLDDYNKKLIKKFGYNPYTISEYINNNTKITHVCNKCDYSFDASPGNILQTNGKPYCPSCNNLIRDTRDYEIRLKEVNPNIINLEPFNGRKNKIKHKCIICTHEWDATPDNRLRGEGCPKCANIYTQSKGEKELLDFIKENYNGTIEERNRKILGGKEIDIYLPELNTAIEYNGLYWHSEKYKGKNSHINKTEGCKKKGIRLIHIFEDEWLNKKEIVKLKVLHILKQNNQEKIYARKCYIEEIDSSFKNEFLERNHIQGKDSSSIKIGLWYPREDSDELVAVMTFVRKRIALGNKDSGEDYELSRFATDLDYRTIGAFSKLFSYFVKNYEFDNIITYADKRWSDGNVYNKNNFIHTHDSKPNYWYVERNKPSKRYHRFNFRKQALKKKFPNIYDDSLTEFEIMDRANYIRIWDCGNMVFKYNKA